MPDARTRRRLLTCSLLFLTCAAYSALRVPAPAVNEPHYLAKAKHYWQPEWCAGDFFLESSNPHQFFFQTVGWLTAVLPLEQAAWIGRILGFAVLAIGWERLLSRVLPGTFGPVLALWLFLLLQSLGNFSGEWLVGGVEAKVFSWGLVFWGGACLLEDSPVRGGMLLGLATSFHPIVGAWCLLLIGVIVACERYGAHLRRRLAVKWKTPTLPAHDGPSLDAAPGGPGSPASVPMGRWLMAAGCCLAASLPGVIPAARLLTATDMAVQTRADLIQVGYRLAHHLDPLAFPVESYRYYALLLAVWWLLPRAIVSARGMRWLTWFTLAAVGLAAAGWLAGAGPRPLQELPFSAARVRFLKLYPFRIADLAVPLMVAVSAVAAADHALRAAGEGRWFRRGMHFAFAAALWLAVVLPGADRNPSRMSPARYADWLAACEWLRTETPAVSLVYAPNEDWAIKWFAGRAEYVNFKDCPQDARGIVEWHRRLVLLRDWSVEFYVDHRFSVEETRALHERTGITHLVVSRLGPIDLEPVHENDSFRIYDIRSGPAGSGIQLD